jgi:hypothetical protein
MRFVSGTDLDAVMSDRQPLDMPRINRIVEQVAQALDAAHSAGLVHRDVKPANILLTGTGPSEHAYLSDFGLTKRLDASTPGPTRSGQWIGTPDYAAPEQIRGLDVDARTDVYSLGCVLHELLTGHPPYEKESSVAKMWAHLVDPPASPRARRPQLLPAFDSLIAKATAKEPEDRFPSAGALSSALGHAVRRQLTIAAAPVVNPAAKAAGATTADASVAVSSPLTGGGTKPQPPEQPSGATVARRNRPARVRDEGTTSSVADRAAVTDAPRTRVRSSRASRIALAAALFVSVIAAIALALALQGAATPHTGAAHRVTNDGAPAKLRGEVSGLNAIVMLFISGKRLSRVEQQYTAAAQNRRLVLQRLKGFHAPSQLRPAAETLREMTVSSLSFNVLMARGQAALARAPDQAHNALRPRFVEEFNRYARRYLGHGYSPSEL